MHTALTRTVTVVRHAAAGLVGALAEFGAALTCHLMGPAIDEHPRTPAIDGRPRTPAIVAEPDERRLAA